MLGGIHHFGLTVRDVDASAAWYVEVLGFHRVGEFESPDGSRRKVFLRHSGLQARLGLTQHRDGGQDAFDETSVGLDHVAFTVADRAELDAWATRLAARAVAHSPVAPANSIPAAPSSCYATRTTSNSSYSSIHQTSRMKTQPIRRSFEVMSRWPVTWRSRRWRRSVWRWPTVTPPTVPPVAPPTFTDSPSEPKDAIPDDRPR
jgi:glyoxylase I family protein